MSKLLDDADGGVIALGGGAVCAERVREALGRHVVVWLQVSAEEAWRRVEGSDRPLAQDRGRFEALHAERQPSTRSSPTRSSRRVTRGWWRGRCPRWSGSASSLTERGWPGRRASRASTRPTSADGLLAAGYWPLEGRRFCVSDSTVAALYAQAVQPLAGLVRGGAGRARQDACRGRARPARAGAARDVARRPPGGAGRRRGRRPGRLLRGDLPARRRGRAGADHAGRPGRLGVRGQDRGRPAGGQELRWRLPPAQRRDRRHGDARHPARPGDGGGLRRGGEDGADRRRVAVGAGAGARGARSRPSSAT